MKKKLMMLAVLLMCVFALSACAKKELSDDIYSYQISIDGKVLQFPMWYSDFEKAGFTYTEDATKTLAPNNYTIGEIWTRDGIEIYTELGNRSINTHPYTKCMVLGIYLGGHSHKEANWEIILPKGIQYGVSTKEDILAAYGTPSTETDDSTYYRMTYESGLMQKISLAVKKESGVLEFIEIVNFVDLEGVDNSVKEAVPEDVKKYTAPTEVGDDLYRFNAEIEGHLYAFPSPVTEFLANGFTVQEDSTDQAIASAGLSKLKLSYNDKSIYVDIRNYADYATIPENCFVTSFEKYGDNDLSLSTFDVTVPCGIKLGDSEDSLIEKLSDFYYETKETSIAKIYKVYNPNGSRADNFEFIIKEGIVAGIELETNNIPGY